jgi:hypothetical protein
MIQVLTTSVHFNLIGTSFVNWLGELQAAVPSCKISMVDSEPDGPESEFCVIQVHYEVAERPLVKEFFGY